MRQASIPVPKRISQYYSIRTFYLRPFGKEARDLDVDFSVKPAPHLVTRILQVCVCGENGNELPVELLWDLTVHTRLSLLLRILFESRPHGLSVPLMCGNPGCRQKIEAELEQDDFEAELRLCEREKIPIKVNNAEYSLRVPLGRHQLNWLCREYPDEAAATQEIIRSLLEKMPEDSPAMRTLYSARAIRSFNKVLLECDPLTTYVMNVLCPDCGRQTDCEIDLQDLAFRELAGIQRNVMYKIHLLAKNYHWSEARILAMPDRRRDAYLRLIENGPGQGGFSTVIDYEKLL
jgi:hypothetical protein